MDVASLVEVNSNPRIPDIAPGDTVKVSARIVEAGKERIQVFQGVVIKIKRGGTGASFTVRHVAYGIGVERTFPFYSPLVEKVEVVRQGKVRRARLYYLRGLSGKAARRKIKRVERKVRVAGEEMPALEPEEVMEPEAVAATAEEPVAEAPVAEEAAAEEPIAEEPIAEAPAAEEQVTEEKRVEAPAFEDTDATEEEEKAAETPPGPAAGEGDE